jgi:D-tyrosyl-tRNA(Tyr) deacylase
MRFVIQRVNHAQVMTDNRTIGSIGKGFLVLIGISQEDTKEIADKMLQKMLNLRIFGDEEDKTNLSLQDVNGELLLISQFTLYANCRKGNRPSFFEAGKPDMANELYEYIIKKAQETCPVVESGKFGAYMKVSLENDGPFTIVLDSDEICSKNS